MRSTFTRIEFLLRCPRWAIGDDRFFDMLLQEIDGNNHKYVRTLLSLPLPLTKAILRRVLAADVRPVLKWLSAQGPTGSVNTPETLKFVSEHKQKAEGAIEVCVTGLLSQHRN